METMMLKAEELRRMVAEATPGPWEADCGEAGCFEIRAEGGEFGLVIASRRSWPNRGDQSAANARLIALAPTLATEHAALQDRVARLEAAVTAMLNAVCGPTGFAEAVRHNSGQAFPWHSLDAAEAQARAALAEAAP